MINKITIFFCAGTFLLAQPVLAEQPPGAVYLDGEASHVALILCHGRGKHPAWKVVNPLRKGVHANLGWHTLSLQMPAENKNWEKYADDFPQAFKTIEQGIAFLQKEKGITTIYLMGHSMGKGLIVAGIRNNGGYPLDGMQNLKHIQIPVLDIWGGGDSKDTDAAREREGLVSASYAQVEIAGSNHKFDGDEDEFVAAVIAWLRTQQ